jgi:hypothetical protein
MFKKSFILVTCMGWQHGQKTRYKLLFWFSLQSGCGGPKKFYSFHLDGCTTCTQKKDKVSFFLFYFMNPFHKFIVSFLAGHFVLLCSPISFSSLYSGEMKICMSSVKKTCLLHGDL